MKTVKVFHGVVNDRTFDNQEEMQKYINYCIEHNIKIYTITNETKFESVQDSQDCECRGGCICSRSRHSDVSISKWPEVYDTFEDYIVPFVVEDAFGNDQSHNDNLIADVEAKLKGRCEYFVENLSNSATSKIKYNHWVTPELVERLEGKSQWCANRISELNKSIKNGDERIKRLKAEIDNIKSNQIKAGAIARAYDTVGGYCDATLESINNDSRYDG